DLRHALTKEVTACGFHSVNAIPHVNRVQIELKDLILGQIFFHQSSNAQLDQLLTQRTIGIFLHHETVLGSLHGDRAESLPNAARCNVFQCGSDKAAPVYSVMLVEAPVFSRDECLAYMHWNLRYGNIDSAHDLEPAHELAGAVVNAAAFVRLIGLDLPRRWAFIEAACEKPRIQRNNG